MKLVADCTLRTRYCCGAGYVFGYSASLHTTSPVPRMSGPLSYFTAKAHWNLKDVALAHKAVQLYEPYVARTTPSYASSYFKFKSYLQLHSHYSRGSVFNSRISRPGEGLAMHSPTSIPYLSLDQEKLEIVLNNTTRIRSVRGS